MSEESFVRREYPDPPPDHMRGALGRMEAEVARERIREVGRSQAHATTVLYRLKGAADFAGRRGLETTANLIYELRAQGIADELIGRFELRREADKRGPGGRRRRLGSFELLYLAMVEEDRVSVEKFWDKISTDLLQACGFEGWVPSLSMVEDRFAQLEDGVDIFESVAQLLIRGAVASDPRITDVVSVDATGWLSPSPLHDACTDGRACEKAREDLKGDRRSDSLDDIAQGHVDEADDPRWGEADYEPSGRTRRPYLDVVQGAGRPRRYGVYDLGGHVKRNTDWSSGIRYYSKIRKLWCGGYLLVAISALLGEPIAICGGPADVNEFDFFPALLAAVRTALGRYPRVMSFDRHYFVRALFRICTERLIAPVAPERAITGKSEHQAWRTPWFDEDGVPRCPYCGGVGNQSGPGLGLRPTRGGPVILARCLDLADGRCGKEFSVPCSLEWLKLTALSQLNPLYWAVAERHQTYERGFRHMRQRFSMAGKDLSTCLYRPGVYAQLLRAQAALLILWLKLSLRNGWLTPLTIEIDVNANGAERLSALQDRRSLAITATGHGAARLRALRERRERDGLHLPYGDAYAALTAALRTEVLGG